MSWIAERMAKAWADGARWVIDDVEGVHEAGYLKLDASRARGELAWRPRLHLGEALDWLVGWYKAHGVVKRCGLGRWGRSRSTRS